MTMRSKFKTDAVAASSGVWVDFPDQPNEDGTVPGFKLARKSSQNKGFADATRAYTRKHLTPEGTLDVASLTEEGAQAHELDTFVNSVLVTWRNFAPDDKTKLKHTKAAAKLIFAHADWVDLYQVLSNKAASAATFKAKTLKAEAKN